MSKITCHSCDKEFHSSAVYCPQCGASQSGLSQAAATKSGTKRKNWYMEGLRKYAVFSGRARRKEYWMFLLISTLVSSGIGVIDGLFRMDTLLVWVYTLMIFIPSVAVAFRRVHDTGRSGLWVFVPVVGFIFMFLAGQPHDNRFGPDPKRTA